LSDRFGRKGLIVAGMWVQAAGLFVTATTHWFGWWLFASVLLGLGTAMVYPTLIAAVSDASHPSWRARSLSVYRFWRDLGYAIGALSAGIIADFFGADAPHDDEFVALHPTRGGDGRGRYLGIVRGVHPGDFGGAPMHEARNCRTFWNLPAGAATLRRARGRHSIDWPCHCLSWHWAGRYCRGRLAFYRAWTSPYREFIAKSTTMVSIIKMRRQNSLLNCGSIQQLIGVLQLFDSEHVFS